MRTKGVALLGVLKSFEALHGRAAYEAAIDTLPEALRDRVVLNGILGGSWYPIEEYRRIHLAAQQAARRGPDLARDLSREATLDDFRGIYRLLTFVLSPHGMLRKAPSAWSRYYDGGRLEIREARDDFAQARFSGCEGFDSTLWQDAIGGCLGVLQACGAKDIDVRVLAGGRDGDQTMEIETRWRV
jgi:hypothetical protein